MPPAPCAESAGVMPRARLAASTAVFRIPSMEFLTKPFGTACPTIVSRIACEARHGALRLTGFWRCVLQPDQEVIELVLGDEIHGEPMHATELAVPLGPELVERA